MVKHTLEQRKQNAKTWSVFYEHDFQPLTEIAEFFSKFDANEFADTKNRASDLEKAFTVIENKPNKEK